MTTGLEAPLSPQQELALRRIALRAPTVDPAVASTLIRLALVERTGRDLRLTPLGECLPSDVLGSHRTIRVGPSGVRGRRRFLSNGG